MVVAIVDVFCCASAIRAGQKAVADLDRLPEAQDDVRRVFNGELSQKKVIDMQPILDDALGKRVLQWEKCAASGEARIYAPPVRRYCSPTWCPRANKNYAP